VFRIGVARIGFQHAISTSTISYIQLDLINRDKRSFCEMQGVLLRDRGAATLSGLFDKGEHMTPKQNRHRFSQSECAPIAGAKLIGPADPHEKIEVTIFLRRGGSYPKVALLEALPRENQRHLSREEFTSKYGATSDDLDKVRRFAAEFGLQVKKEGRARRSVVLEGTVEVFSRAFEVRVDRYEHSTKGSYRGRTGSLTIPSELSGVIEGVFGLDNRPQAKPHFRVRSEGSKQPQSQAQPGGYDPRQVAQAYNFPTAVDGSGQSIAILELGGGFSSRDLDAFFGDLHLSTPQVSAIGVGGGSNSPTGDPSGADGEVVLDVEVAGAIAPGAQIAVYFAPNTDQGFLDALTTAIHDTVVKPTVIAIGWGGPENTWTQQALNAFDSAAQDAALMGITIFVAAGDDGATDGDPNGILTVDFPASCPYMTGCGGTQLFLSGSTSVREVVWNDQGGATGGGVSQTFTLPTWQMNANVPNSPNGIQGRGVPDVAANASPSTGYKIVVEGSFGVIGGTSAAASLWAGLCALINQSLGQPVGYINPFLAKYASNPKGFNEIVAGNNNGYGATPGWNPCAGFGSPNGRELLELFTRLVDGNGKGKLKVMGDTVYESSGAIPEVRPSVPFAEEKAPREPGKRYADFTFYRRSNRGRPRAEVGPQEPLAKTESYDLEVAVRTKPAGIPMRDPKEAREGISEPRKGEDVDVLVIASSTDFDIPDPVQRLRLPPSGNSTKNAVFKEVRPAHTTPSKDNLAKITVRLLYNLNLLEHAIIDAEVVSSLEDSATSILGLDKTIGLHQDLSFREYRNFELIQPRQMNIFVRGIQGGFELAFTLLREGRPGVVLTGTTQVFDMSLEAILATIRRRLLGISMWEEFENGIVCQDSAKFEEGLRVLVQDGRELWTKLFQLDVHSALYQIGFWLKEHPLPDHSLIQVSIARSASRFVLPWNLLYDRELGEGAPDPQGFWGFRYQIEQETDQEKKKGDAPTVPAKPLEIGFLVSRFHEAGLQEKFLNGIATASKGRVAKVVPIDTAKAALDYLQNHTKQFVLFFAHGHTQFPEAARVGASEADFLTQYEKLPKKSSLRKAWTDLYETIKKKKYDSDKSWIKLQHGKLFLLDLYAKVAMEFGQEPMVLLNMCESAQLTPSLQESFIHFFLNRGARVVIGTECSMRPLFAHHFAKELLGGILSGRAVGDVMLEARLHFMRKNNPLGLAYTLFGSPLTRFQPAPLEDRAEEPNDLLGGTSWPILRIKRSHQ